MGTIWRRVDLKAGTWYHAVLTCQADATSLTFTLYWNGSALSPKVVVSKWDAQLPSGGSLRLGRQTDGVLTDNMVPQFYGLIDIAVESKTPYYTAVWRRSGEGEIQVYEWDYKNFKNRYNHLWKDGWRLKLLDVWSSKGIEEGRPGSRSSAAPDTVAGLFTATLFPNPSGKDSRVRLHIELPQDQPVRINAWDMTGKLYWTTESPLQHGEQDVDIPTDALAPGVYVLEIATPTGRKTIKWMVTATD
ncbi:MAG: T9SS type A sorting domain-containing protein [Saprospirales bacterium]|nr:T9SS type A sorting domain-containing protein [Saprospirales bacterium]